MKPIRQQLAQFNAGAARNSFGPTALTSTFGVTPTTWLDIYNDGLSVGVDAITLWLGTPDGTFTEWLSNPTDGLLASEPVIVAPSMRLADDQLASIVNAIEDVALIDFEYIANQAGQTWSMRGMVRVP
jgi:hypothetical protein